LKHNINKMNQLSETLLITLIRPDMTKVMSGTVTSSWSVKLPVIQQPGTPDSRHRPVLLLLHIKRIIFKLSETLLITLIRAYTTKLCHLEKMSPCPLPDGTNTVRTTYRWRRLAATTAGAGRCQRDAGRATATGSTVPTAAGCSWRDDVGWRWWRWWWPQAQAGCVVR
jgi:hypothetical protein